LFACYSSQNGTSIGGHIQDGGVNNIGSLYVSTETASFQRVSVGSYIMNGGELHTSYIGVGAEGSGTFEQNAGDVTITLTAPGTGRLWVGAAGHTRSPDISLSA
jgi:hypothetical protein